MRKYFVRVCSVRNAAILLSKDELARHPPGTKADPLQCDYGMSRAPCRRRTKNPRAGSAGPLGHDPARSHLGTASTDSRCRAELNFRAAGRRHLLRRRTRDSAPGSKARAAIVALLPQRFGPFSTLPLRPPDCVRSVAHHSGHDASNGQSVLIRCKRQCRRQCRRGTASAVARPCNGTAKISRASLRKPARCRRNPAGPWRPCLHRMRAGCGLYGRVHRHTRSAANRRAAACDPRPA